MNWIELHHGYLAYGCGCYVYKEHDKFPKQSMNSNTFFGTDQVGSIVTLTWGAAPHLKSSTYVIF